MFFIERKTIKYIGFYDTAVSETDRVCNLAATNKMNYIADTLVEAGYEVQFISPSWMGDHTKVSFEMQKKVNIGKHKYVTYCPSWKTRSKFMRNIKILGALIWLFIYLLLTTKKNEKVIAYHVQWISLPVRMAKSIRKFDLVLEVEEIYSDVMVFNDRFVKWEKALLNQANAFLYSTDLLKDKLAFKKPSVVIYGEYKTHPKLSNPPDDGKIHLLYAGIIDEHKKGAFNALEATRHLSNKYELHILGHGKVDEFKNIIFELNKTNKCKIYFDGIKSGDEYVDYCQKCHVGLSTQTMSGPYEDSSFPSKIMSYLALGLRVVSSETKCVTESKISNLITFYKEDEPKSIAESIMTIHIDMNYDSSKEIDELHKEFSRALQTLLED